MDEEQDYDEETRTVDDPTPSEVSPYGALSPFEQYEYQDPDPRRRTGRMPPQLAKYWRQYDMGRRPRRRKRASGGRRRRRRARRASIPAFHPAMRRRRHSRRRAFPRFDMRMPVLYHRRRHDPAIMLTKGGAFWGAILQPIVTTIGGIFHNYLVARQPKLAGGVKVGSGAVGYLGLAGGAIGAGLDLSGKSMFGSMANAFGSGMLSEAVNVPGAEGIATIPTRSAYMKGGMAGMAGPRLVQSMPSMQPGTF